MSWITANNPNDHSKSCSSGNPVNALSGGTDIAISHFGFGSSSLGLLAVNPQSAIEKE